MNKQRRGKQKWLIFMVVLVIGAYICWALLRPLPLIQPSKAGYNLTFPTKQGVLAWPSQGQAAASVLGSSIIETHGEQKPVPTASTAKVITALVVLQKKPLRLNQPGPLVTITANDVANYNQYVSQDGSVLPVVAGEQLSEYQILQAIMLPSANNIADKMAAWAYGSQQAYTAAANSYLAAHHITNTHVGSDASGLNPDTTSTAEDLVKIGKLAMQEPVLAQVVAQSTATGLPLTTVVKNVNSLLGRDGIVGIKTGNSDQAGGVFLGAAKTIFKGKPVMVVTAVAATADLGSALSASLPLLQTAQKNFVSTVVEPKNNVLATYTAPWGATAKAIIRQDMATTAWQGETIKGSIRLQPLKPATTLSSKIIGTATVEQTSITPAQTGGIYLDRAVQPPSIMWRLAHPW